MKKMFSLLFIFVFISGTIFASGNFLYLVDDSDRSSMLEDYPLFIRFGSERILLGDDSLMKRHGLRDSGKEFEGTLMIAAERHGHTVNILPANVEILYTNGAYVLFSTDNSTAEGLLDIQDPDILIRKAQFPSVIFKKVELSRTAVKNENIVTILEKIDKERLFNQVKVLEDYGTRYSFHETYKNIADDMKKIFEEIGYSSEVEKFTSWSGKSYNVKAVKPGRTKKQILVVGHLDSTSPQYNTLAPGADDNGSGSAGVLEMARVLKDVELEHTVVFILFGGEENGLLGSTDYAKKYAEQDSIEFVINMDMIGFFKNNENILFLEAYDFCEDFMYTIADAGRTYAGFESEISYSPFGSDHMPFLRRNIKAVLTIEKDWDANHNYHQVTDTTEDMSAEYLERVVKTNTAALLMLDR